MKKAKIVCAPNVSESAFESLCEKFRKQYGEISFEKETDDTLIGGFIVLFDGKVYDASLRAQLDAMRAACEQ